MDAGALDTTISIGNVDNLFLLANIHQSEASQKG